MKILILSFFILSGITNADEILYSCSQAKTELFDLEKESSDGYKKGSMTIDIIIKDKKVYVKSNTSESELLYLGNTSSPQFLEKVSSGHFVLYSVHEKSKVMTIQKSYSMIGHPIMVNSYLRCR
ncbi:hypothetical protein ACLHDG_00220 [Sulfurovum sp. CS9]|uniref:hypothetical protein n=1 Tax=Sulfurovum sp. CS9 TaxID=3391146 RepID=UPI0039EBFE5E